MSGFLLLVFWLCALFSSLNTIYFLFLYFNEIIWHEHISSNVFMNFPLNEIISKFGYEENNHLIHYDSCANQCNGQRQLITPVDVGATDDPLARKVRIVHISDTHMKHDVMLKCIPPGDILVHSGDFAQFHWTRFFKFKEYISILNDANEFFSKLPHTHKIFVPGNHELYFEKEDLEDLQRHIPNAIYLQDRSVTLNGIKFHGNPWTLKRSETWARGYTANWDDLVNCWAEIPLDIDVLITHMYPYRIRDLDELKHDPFRYCSTEGHPSQAGSRVLLNAVMHRIRPALHLFGHIHEENHVTRIGNITFSNAAMDINHNPRVFDYYVPVDKMSDGNQ